ncbi:PIN domain-containing protein [Streptomyces sp. NPDC004596]
MKSYLISFDTNVLLELYRFTPAARNELLTVMEQLRERIWVPNQVASEYYARRMDAVKDQLKLYEAVPRGLEELKRKASQELQTFAKRCSLTEADRKLLLAPIEESFRRALKEVKRHSTAFDLTLEGTVSDDPILSSLARILDSRVGDPFSDGEIDALKQEADRRYTEKIPPGYKDASKNENAHGDFFIWEQLLRETTVRESSLLFVTNDTKEDWVTKESGLVIGARPELIAEFRSRCGKDFLIAQLSLFLKFAKEELGAAVSASTLEQAKNLQEESGEKYTVEVILDTDELRTVPDALIAQAETFDSYIEDPRWSAFTHQKAKNAADRAIALANRLEALRAAGPTHGNVRVKIDRSDLDLLSRVVNGIRHRSRPISRLSMSARQESQQELARQLSELTAAKTALTVEHDAGVQLLRELQIEVDSLRSTEESGRRLLEAEVACKEASKNLRMTQYEIAHTDAKIERVQNLMKDRIHADADALQRRLPESD